MFKINICGTIHEVDSVEIKNQHIYIDGVSQGVIGFTVVIKVTDGEYDFIKKDGHIRWLSK